MKKATLILTLLIAVIAISYYSQTQKPDIKALPIPTNGETIVKYGEEGQERAKREAWFALMHQAEEGVSWQNIEYLNQMNKQRQKQALIGSRSGCELLEIADGQLKGFWKERGSVNQAGSVHQTAYDPVADEIWVISDGGTLFKSDRYGLSWRVVNQDVRFTSGLLRFVPLADGGRRLLAGINRVPHYSDDEGETWTPTTGLEVTDGWGNFHSPVVLDDEQNTIYLFAKSSYWENIKLYKSSDKGASFQQVQPFFDNDFNNYKLCKPHHTDEVFLTRKTEDGTGLVYHLDTATDALIWINESYPINFGDSRANLIGTQTDDSSITFYCYADQLSVLQNTFQADNIEQEWMEKGILPTRPWGVGMYVLPSNPDVLFYGEVELYRSFDGGEEWEKINNWWDYYDQVESKIHADIMHMEEFTSSNGQSFLMVSNHGGLTYSSNQMQTQINIGLEGLNVSQYYSVKTDPLNPSFVYAGSQDQGFQRATGFETGGEYDIEYFNQVISGDYGHIVFSGGGQSLWTVYPGGWVTYYPIAQTGGYSAAFDLESENESVWLAPLMSSPFENDWNAIYMAGGNYDGGPGSYLIRLELLQGEIAVTQGTFDFKAESEGELSAIEASLLNNDKFYGATTNGRFFYSNDGGNNWSQSLNFVPSGHYLYGQSILASKVDENTVYLAGSGYSNPAVYKSTDGGQNFVSMAEGLPSTLVFELAANEDESVLFAATEAGPYVYLTAEGQWYDLSAFCAPTHTYWSVEYIESIKTARFGTYGRGIWDFVIDEEVDVIEPEATVANLNLFPNPAKGQTNVKLSKAQSETIRLQVYDLSGKLLMRLNYQAIVGSPWQTELDLSTLAQGTYLIEVLDGQNRSASQLVLQ